MPAWSFQIPSFKVLLLSLLVIYTVQLGISDMLLQAQQSPGLMLPLGGSIRNVPPSVDASWYPPVSNNVNNLDQTIDGHGTYGFMFDSSILPPETEYGTYNWCNMPHVRATEYPRVNSSYELQYVEVIHRHHKRTPYAANTFPVEQYPWSCDDAGLFYSGAPLPVIGANQSSSTYWSVYTSKSNPLEAPGFPGTCQFPQITRGGLDDSHQHGVDLFSVYSTLLDFLPSTYSPAEVSYRVTHNTITSQVVSMVIPGMYPGQAHQNTPLLIQPPSIDSLEPDYYCPAATRLYSSFGPGSSDPTWQSHLDRAAPLFSALDSISGISPEDPAWHNSLDHYFDTLSARLCHDKPLPCNIANPSQCVTREQADQVFRLGEWEYSYMYRDASQQTLDAAVASYGIWTAELAANLRAAMTSGDGKSRTRVKYRHNVAHDGSVSRLLAILQVEKMVWPGMGSEVVFELYKGAAGGADAGGKSAGIEEYFLRVLWSGQVLRSSSPTLGTMDMVPVKRLLDYFDTLVGVNASKIHGLCNS